MADISAEITAFKNAVYGKDVRDAMVSLANKLNFSVSFFDASPAITHRTFYRGKSLGTSLTSVQKSDIDNGSFNDMYIGDYWTINSRVYRIADINYFYNTGDTSFTKNHLVIVPDGSFGNGKMNSTNITTGAYVGSEMYTDPESVLNIARSTIATDFGDALATHRLYLQNATTDGYSSAGAWYDSTVDLMNEPMVYGSYIHTPSNNGSRIVKRYTVEKTQLALFQLNPRMINTRASYWLRNVVSGALFAFVGADALAGVNGASASYAVRPFFVITGN